MVSSSRVAKPALSALPTIVVGFAAVAAAADPLLPDEIEKRTRYETEYPVIAYASVRPTERIAALQDAIDAGSRDLEFDATHGYLGALLGALGIEPSSQLLVFSRTSVNVSHIRPRRPRAIYFNDDAYVGWVPESGMLEIATMDAQLGPVFFVLEQRDAERPQFDRQTVQCLRCHDSLTMTGGGVPRFILGSGYIDTRGNLVSHEGWILTSPATPLKFRWGGWYVTGAHGEQPHLGNIVVKDPATLQDLESLRIYNRQSLDGVIDEALYLTDQSDIVALLVIEHQVHVQNLITRVNYDVRTALARENLRKSIDNSGNKSSVSAETKSLIEDAAEALARAMLFADEAELMGPVIGSTGYVEWFEKQGPHDGQGRSLRQLDLRTRVFRYPLSYLVYSDAFDGLPELAKQYIYRRFVEILGEGRAVDIADRWSSEERGTALEILRATSPSFSAWEGERIADGLGS